MDDLHTETSADAPQVGNGAEALVRPAHLAGTPIVSTPVAPRRRRRWVLPIVLLPVVLLVVLTIAWVVDTNPGEVGRNVEVAGVPIGGLSEDELAGRVGDVAADFAAMPVELHTDDMTYTTTAGEIGLMVEEDETAAAAMDVGEDAFLLARPFAWAKSLFTTRDAPLELQVNAEQVATTVVDLEGDAPDAAHRADGRAGRRRVHRRPRRRRPRHRPG